MDPYFLQGVILGAIIGILAGLLVLSRQRERRFLGWSVLLAKIIMNNINRTGKTDWIPPDDMFKLVEILEDLKKEFGR